MELIDERDKKRLFIRVEKKTKIGDLKRFLTTEFAINNNSILLQNTGRKVTDDMTLIEAGLCTGSGVIITK